MGHEVRIERVSSRPLAVVRRRAKANELSRVVPEACGLVWKILRAQKVAGAGRHVAVYIDREINLEVGVELESPFLGNGELIASATPCGLVATTTHFGPYGQLSLAHDAIHSWCQNNGHLPVGPNWEIYGHWKSEWNSDPSKICTDVFYLLC